MVKEEQRPATKDRPAKEMSVEEFVRKGFLQEVNRLLLNPSGLFLSVKVSKGGRYSFGKIVDLRERPEEAVIRKPLIEMTQKALLVSQIASAGSTRRSEILGWTVQPLREEQ